MSALVDRVARAIWYAHVLDVRPAYEAGWSAVMTRWDFDGVDNITRLRFTNLAYAAIAAVKADQEEPK